MNYKAIWYACFKRKVYKRTIELKKKQLYRIKRFRKVLNKMIQRDKSMISENIFQEAAYCSALKIPRTKENVYLVMHKSFSRNYLFSRPDWRNWVKQFPL
jgi:hypothetical protein